MATRIEYDDDGTPYIYEWDDGTEEHLSPWEQAHGGVEYDPANTAQNAPNAFDAYVEDLYERDPTGEAPTAAGVNLYDPSTFDRWPGPGPQNNPDPPSPTAPSPRPGGTAPHLGPLLGGYPGTFTKPGFGVTSKQLIDLIGPAPTFAPPDIPTIDPFTYDPYTPTTADHVFADPSYGLRKNVGEKALLNNRAAQGLARTGGTLKDLLDYNQNFASQEFGNVDARRFRDYQTGFGNALEGWRSNADTTLRRAGLDQDRARSIYEPQFREWDTRARVIPRAEEKARDDAFQEFLTDESIWRSNQRDIFDRLKWASEFGLDAASR